MWYATYHREQDVTPTYRPNRRKVIHTISHRYHFQRFLRILLVPRHLIPVQQDQVRLLAQYQQDQTYLRLQTDYFPHLKRSHQEDSQLDTQRQDRDQLRYSRNLAITEIRTIIIITNPVCPSTLTMPWRRTPSGTTTLTMPSVTAISYAGNIACNFRMADCKSYDTPPIGSMVLARRSRTTVPPAILIEAINL